MQAIILAGGRGRRLTPFTERCPKPLVPLGERPILDTILRQLKHFGFTHVTLAVGHMAEQIQHYVGSGARYGLEVSYTFEAEPLGTAGPLALVEQLERRFLVMNGDLITSLNYDDLFAFHRERDALATIGTCPKMFQIDLGIIQADERAQITDYIEKPSYTFQVSMGIYVFEAAVLNYIEPNKYFDFPDLVKQLLAAGERVVSYPFDGYWMDIGNHVDYEKALEEYQVVKGNLHLD